MLEGENVSIYRVKKNNNYTVMDRTALNDERLSWKAKGIIAYMLSMPDDWKFYVSEISQHAKDGEDSLRTGIKELKTLGYIKRFPIRDKATQKILHWETHVFEKPHGEFPDVEKPDVEKPQVENPTLLSTDSKLSTDKPNTDIPYVEIIEYFNKVTGKHYKPTTKSNQKLIKERWNEDFRIEDFKRVIDIKYNEWKNDPKMKKFIRPQTLFNGNFESYLNQEDNTQPRDQYDELF